MSKKSKGPVAPTPQLPLSDMPIPQDRAALKLLVSQIVLELYKEEDFVLDIDDAALASKFSKRVSKLEQDNAELRARIEQLTTGEKGQG